jgi:hypothetical protein
MSAQTANKLNEQAGLLVIYMAKHQVGSELAKVKDRIIKVAKQRGEDVDILIDVSDVRTSEESANTVARTFFEDLPFKHMAVFGGSRAVNVGIKLVLNLFISPGAGEVKLFRSEQKARDWLKSVA